MTDPVPEVKVETTRESLIDRASIVWLVPLAALVIAVAVAWSTWSERGPLVEIAFADAGGVAKGETELRYRDVPVGVVEDVRFSASLDRVIVAVRLDKEVAAYVDADAQFWIVEPKITTSGISGLETVLSGVYLEAFWDSEPGGFQRRFEGLEDAPLLTSSQSGLRIELRSSRDSGLAENTPIMFKGINVGRVGPARISRDGNWVFADAIIYEPHDTLVTTATRFWDASGFSFNIGPTGAEIDFTTLASLIAGGLTFDTLISGGRRAGDGMVFEVYPDETTARNSVFEDSDGTRITVSVLFEDNVSGLTARSPVEWRGVRVGEVANVTGIVDADRFGDQRVRLLATLDLTPSRFGLTGEVDEEQALTFLAERIEAGLRARLTTASILTGGLKVEFVQLEDAPEAALDRSTEPFPTMPTTESEIADVTATAEGVFQRLNALPVEDLLDSAIQFLDNATAFVTQEDFRETPTELRGLLADARGVIGAPEIQAIPSEISEVLGDLSAASEDLRGIMEEIAEAEAVARFAAAIDNVGSAAEAAETTLAEIPALAERIGTLAERASALPLEDLVAEVTGLAEEARGVIGSEAAQALPGAASEAVAKLDALLVDAGSLARTLTERDVAGELSEALGAARAAATSLSEGAEGLPSLIERLDAVAASAETLPLDTLVAEITSFAEEARGLVGSEAAQGLPDDLSGALERLDGLLARLQEQDAAGQLSEALLAAEEAANDVSEAVAGVPQVVERIDAIAAKAETLPLERIADELAQVLETADTLLGDASRADLPETLAGALDQAEAAIAELREGGLIENANQTLAAAERAATAIAEAAGDLPVVVRRINTALGQAQLTLANYDENSQFGRQAQSALREVEKAAEALASLARAIERRPNSIILGR